MKPTKTFLSALVIATGLSAGAVFVVPAIAQDAGATVRDRSDWLTIPQIHERVEAAGYRDISEIERERNGYEVKAVDRDGQRVELDVDPRTGEVTDVETKRDKSRDRRDPRDGDRATTPGTTY